jgi:hypothetical protein
MIVIGVVLALIGAVVRTEPPSGAAVVPDGCHGELAAL